MQVCNVRNAVKVACDFLSIENLARTHHIASELRLQRLVSQGDDILQLHTALWYAWCTVTVAEAMTGKGYDATYIHLHSLIDQRSLPVPVLGATIRQERMLSWLPTAAICQQGILSKPRW